MLVYKLPQSLLDQLPGEIWLKIQEINNNELKKIKEILTERFHFHSKYSFEKLKKKAYYKIRRLTNGNDLLEILRGPNMNHLELLVVEYNHHEIPHDCLFAFHCSFYHSCFKWRLHIEDIFFNKYREEISKKKFL